MALDPHATRVIAPLLLCLMLLFGWAGSASAGDIKVRVTWHGVYATTTDAMVKDSSTFTGQRIISTGVVPPAASSDRIPAIAGTRFGFGYEIAGVLPGVRVDLTWVRRFPPGGIRDAVTGQRIEVERAPVAAIAGRDDNFVGYRFDRPEELLWGPWTFELWQGEIKLAEQRFEVVAP